ncbi:MAG: DNA polymerase/3'-5' exonuclease PolX [Candidatus Omnitrophota bacterium]
MKNLEIAQTFRDIAQILEIKGENVFRVRAYQRAAQNIEGLGEDLETLVKQDRLQEIPGVGKDLSERIKEFLRTGKLNFYEELKKSIPHGLLELLAVPSIGPKTAKLLFEKLKIKNIAGLEKAIKQNKLRGIFGIKEKTIENILKGIEVFKKGRERMTLAGAAQIGEEFVNALKILPEVNDAILAGSLRRQKETVRDIDILVTSAEPQKVMDAFVSLPRALVIQAKGQTKSSLRTAEGVQVDCRVVEEKSFGAALMYFTGSKNFNIKLRQMAIKIGLKLNEYGIFRKDRFVCGKTEKDIFKALGLAYIPPELREDAGEIELARAHQLPRLVELADIKGDLHVHSLWSDGKNTLEEIARDCIERGYSYAAITDHSQGLKIAHGLKPADLKKKKIQIEQLNKKLRNFTLLYAAEVDIDAQGRLDYRDEILKEFDLVAAAIHSGFKQSKEQLTRRITRACQNKYAHIIAHLTGKLWGEREAYEVDFEQILKAARDTNTHLEINSFPRRLDMDSQHARRAKDMGVKIAVSTDAHSIDQLGAMQFGVAVARRGWLSCEDVINTLSLEKLLKALRK